MNKYYAKFVKIASKPARTLDYAILKFTSSAQALIYQYGLSACIIYAPSIHLATLCDSYKLND